MAEYRDYEVTVPIESAHGYQFFKVRARSESEAVSKFKRSGGEFLREEVEVESLDDNDAVASPMEEAPDA